MTTSNNPWWVLYLVTFKGDEAADLGYNLTAVYSRPSMHELNDVIRHHLHVYPVMPDHFPADDSHVAEDMMFTILSYHKILKEIRY